MTDRAPRRRIPIFATVVVLCAAATMVGLGVWQLERLSWKNALLERYAVALGDDTPVAWPTEPHQFPSTYFRRSTVTCARDVSIDAMSGRNAAGEAGWVHVVQCLTADGVPAAIQLGWSRDPAPATYAGGTATGRISPFGGKVRLVADPPLAGLQASAAPDPREIPNNHLAYAMQWFFFAATALVIYAIALRKRLRP